MHNLPDWFPELWKEEVTRRPQQLTTRVHDRIASGGMFKGDACYMPRVGTVEAMDAARLQQFATQAPALDWISVKAAPKFLPIKIWDPDKDKLTIPVVQEFAHEIRSGIARARDDMVIDAIEDAVTNGVAPVRGRSAEAQAAPAVETIDTIGDYNTVLDWDAIAEAIAKLGSNEVDVEHEEITLLSSWRIKVQLSLDPLLTSANTRQEDLPWSMVRRISSERLPGLAGNRRTPGDNTGCDCYLVARSAAVSAYNTEVTEINERLGNILADMFGQWFQGGAAVKEAKKIIRLKSKNNFTIDRGAVKVDNIGN